jgi:redox-sensitive bicupin YhaK (pirin superfamily)
MARTFPPQHLVVLDPRRSAIGCGRGRRLKAMLFGGEALDAPRHMWWNFVSSSKDRIEQAKQDWWTDASGRSRGDGVHSAAGLTR